MAAVLGLGSQVAPLVPDIEEAKAPFRENEVDHFEHLVTLSVWAVAVGGMLAGALAMILEGSFIVYFAFAFIFVAAPCVMYQRQRIQWLPSKQSRSKAPIAVVLSVVYGLSVGSHQVPSYQSLSPN